MSVRIGALFFFFFIGLNPIKAAQRLSSVELAIEWASENVSQAQKQGLSLEQFSPDAVIADIQKNLAAVRTTLEEAADKDRVLKANLDHNPNDIHDRMADTPEVQEFQKRITAIIQRYASRLGITKNVNVAITSHEAPYAGASYPRIPTIMIPFAARTLTPAVQQFLVLHELAHCAQPELDSSYSTLASHIMGIFPPHGAFEAAQQFKHGLEYLADTKVAALGPEQAANALTFFRWYTETYDSEPLSMYDLDQSPNTHPTYDERAAKIAQIAAYYEAK